MSFKAFLFFNFYMTFRIKAELISTAGQRLTFGPVEVRIGRKIHNERPNKKVILFSTQMILSFWVASWWMKQICQQKLIQKHILVRF